MRDELTPPKRWAHAVLDDVRDGFPQPDSNVRFALQITGELWMSTLTPNDWTKIRAHYARALPLILAGKSNEWAIDAYAWEGAGIRMTPIEAWLWSDLRAADVVMYPQFPVGGMFVDFGNPVAKVAIECDGRAYHQDKAKDADRDAKLAALGWTVYRLTGSECRQDFDEETRTAGAARELVDSIARRHAVQRSAMCRHPEDLS